MRLKSIKLVGFKSFVDSTVVPFPTNMTAIVGPNGCGKSNVIDAVRWVMGESSAKHLRGESMTDVIFNGSTHRQPVGQASIELLFDNSQGQLTGEHAAFAEISIKRKVTREGVSQYYLNGSKCRRRDVTDIFLGTGMGPRSYAIIEQGMISRLIESKPEELRVYLEEAAGISKYKERRRETENRMRRTQENLDRLTDIREELGKQLSTLKRQANAAERFKDYKAEERKTSALLAALQWQELQTVKLEQQAASSELEQQIEDLVLEKASGQSRIEAVRSELEEAIESFQALQGQYYQSGAEIAKLEQQIKFERERAERAAEEKSRVVDDMRRSEERLNLLKEEMSERNLELESIAPELEVLQEQQEVNAEQVAQAESAFQEWLHHSESLQESYSDARREADSQQARVSGSEAQIQQTNSRLVSLNDELSNLKGQVAEMASDSFGAEIELSEARIEELSAQIATAEDELEQLDAKLSDLDESVSTQRSELASLKASRASLVSLQEDALEQRAGKESKFHQWAESKGMRPLIESLEIEAGWESIVESVLADALHGVVSEESLESVGDLGAFDQESFVLFSKRSGNPPIEAGSLSEKVAKSTLVHGLLNSYLCVETLSEALQRQGDLGAGQRLVSKDGFVVTGTSVQSFGSSVHEDGVVNRQNKIDALAQSIAMTTQTLEQGLASKHDLEASAQELRTRLKVSRGDLSSLNKQQSALASQSAALSAKREQLTVRCQRIEAEMHESKAHLEEQRAVLEESRIAWQAAMENLDEMSGSREQHSEERDRLRQTIDAARDQQRDVQSKLHAQTLSRQKTGDRVEVLRQLISDLEYGIESQQAKLTALVDVEADLDLIGELNAKLQDELVAHERDEKRLVEARKAQEALQAQLREQEQGREKSESQLVELRSRLEKQRLQVQALEMEQSQKIDHLQQDQFVLEDLLSELSDTPKTADELNQELERLASRIQRLGPINLAAVDEYEAQSERKNYLDMQNEELTEALATLEGAIRKIDKETRARFKETYDRVNHGLQTLFPKIFGGGSASLELTDSDLLETGVSIIARPPGKNNSTIHLLSGGEKALTALALIFSIFKLNPAPFCMLDEVDAPLDDANVGRFARLVKEMSATVQFIYISHNKVSMEMADQLMGVTMHEPGVSRLVSVDIDAAAQLAEA